MAAARALDVLLGAGGAAAAALPAAADRRRRTPLGVTALSRGEVHGGAAGSRAPGRAGRHRRGHRRRRGRPRRTGAGSARAARPAAAGLRRAATPRASAAAQLAARRGPAGRHRPAGRRGRHPRHWSRCRPRSPARAAAPGWRAALLGRRWPAAGPAAVPEGEPDMTAVPPRLRHQRLRQPPARRRARRARRPRLRRRRAHPRPHHLDPFAPTTWPARTAARRPAGWTALGLAVVVETGARYLLDPRRKHHPTLVDRRRRGRRVDFLRRAIRIAADLGAEAVSFWSGIRPSTVDPTRSPGSGCVAGVAPVLAEAGRARGAAGARAGAGHVRRAPGRRAAAARASSATRSARPHPRRRALPVPGAGGRGRPASAAAGAALVNVQIDDMRRGVHEHLEFGDGRDRPARRCWRRWPRSATPALAAVELPRHSHAAPDVAAPARSPRCRAAIAGPPVTGAVADAAELR